MRVYRHAISILLITSLQCLATVSGCVCVPRHPQNIFCRSDFVMKAIVISEMHVTNMEPSVMLTHLRIPQPTYVHYVLHVTKIFKGESTLRDHVTTTTQHLSNKTIRQVSVHTPLHDSNCGVRLSKGKKYLINGLIFHNKLQINKCGSVKEFKSLSRQVKNGLHGKFECTCKVGTCIDNNCDVGNDCNWHVMGNGEFDACTQNHRVCEYSHNKCQWSVPENVDFVRCEKETEDKRLLPV